ncbi:THAP domain containing 12a [Osmerus mordax]|uniref:THAP domain containing 12a n=1 Tax=Osmerus mordax TaxID=8014 RepID=UPI0035103C8B
MANNCAFSSCTSNNCSLPSLPPLFRFPRNSERCKKWIENCNRIDLEDKTPDELYRQYRLCAKHFEDSVMETTLHNTALKEDAIPTIFDSSGQPTNPTSGQCKRKGEIQDDPQDSKVKKDDLIEKTEDDSQIIMEDTDPREILKSICEVLLVLSKQNIPLNRHAVDVQESVTLSNVQALLEYRMSVGNQVLTPGKELCSSTQLSQMLEVCENGVREEFLQEVRESRFFSLVTDDLVDIEEQCHLPVFLRFVDQSNCLREEFVGLLPFQGDEETLTEQLLSMVTDKWGLNIENCRGQAHLCSGVHASKMKAISTRLTEKYPMILHSTLSTFALNTFLVNSMSLSGPQIVMSTFKKIESFFKDAPSLKLELENAISIFYQGREEKTNELKEACRTSWTLRHDAFEVAVDIIESLLLCVDSVHDNEDMRWSDEVTHNALEISTALADFEFIIALVVLKNTLSFTRAFGKNLQGQATDTYFAANNLTAVLHSLNEVSDNIDVYHEFWFEEAINLASAMEIQVKVPRLYLRKHRSESGTEVQPENYYKEHLSVPVVTHVLNEMKDLFTESHIKAMKCLLLVPAVMGQLKFNASEENMDVFKNDLPNAETLPAELHCWWVKWKHRVKDVTTLPSSVPETLLLAEVKFFPNVLAFLKVLATLPFLTAESSCDAARKRLKLYVENTPGDHRSKSIIFLNMHYNATHNLDFIVDTYMEKYPEKE